MNKIYVFFIFSVLTLMTCAGCNGRKMYNELAKADSLLTKELPDSAFKELLTIGQPAENDRECKAYHALLVTQARYLLYMSIDSCSDIDYAIEYYKETGDKGKLARALHWKAGLLSEADRYVEAIEAEKGAEANVNENTNPVLGIRIYNKMSWLNNKTNNFLLAKKYAFKALHLAERLKNEKYIAEMYYRISFTYTELEQVDSALYYIEKALPLIDYTPLKSSIILQAALCYRNTEQWAKAEEYVKKGMGVEWNNNYEGLLGDIYIQTGRADEGVAILRKILPELELEDKWQAMQLIEDVMMKQGRYAEAARLQETITLMKDSIAKGKHTVEALAVQKEFDMKVEEAKAKEAAGTRWQRYAIAGGVCAVVTVAVIFGCWYRFVVKRRHDREMAKAKEENAKAQERIYEAEDKITKVKAENDRKAEEIDILNKKKKKDEREIAKAVIRGKELYESICTDKNFSISGANDYTYIVAYYRTVNPDFFAKIEKTYSTLTDYNRCILLFKEENNFDNARICCICRMSSGALRTLISRLNSRRHEAGGVE